MKQFLLIATLALTLSSCSSRTNHSPIPSISTQSKDYLAKPVNCSTAKNDIKILEAEQASVGKRIVAGVRSVFPIAVVAGLLTGDYSDRVKVASGSYNDAIISKIDEIKVTCNIN